MFKHKIARKLLLPHIGGFFILLFLFGTGFFALRTAYQSQHLITEEMVELHLVNHLKLAVLRVVMPANDYLIAGGEPNEEANFSHLSVEADKLFGQLGALKFDREEESVNFNLAKDKFAEVKALAKIIFSFKEPYGNPEAGRLMEEMDAQAEGAIQALDKFEEIALTEHDEALKKVEATSQRAQRIFIATLILSILGLMFLGVILPWLITQPIIKLHQGAELIGKGDLTQRISIRSGDELEELANEFNRMSEHLQASYSQLEDKVKERTKDLQAIKDRLTTVTEGIEEGIMLLDRDFKILWANKKIMQASGLKIGEVLDNYCYKVTHNRQDPCQPPYDICPITEVLKAEKPVTLTHTHFDKEGNKFYAEVSAYPLRNELGEINQFVHVSRDVTERIKLEEELKAAQAKLIQTAKMAAVGELAGGVAHEINNPLTGVLNNVQLLKLEAKAKKEFSLSDFKELLDIIEESALRCKRITQSLLDFSRAGKKGYKPTNINEVVEKVLLLAEYEIKMQNIKVIKELANDLPLVLADTNQLQQVCLDIINNAKWAMQAKKTGELSIKTQISSDHKSVIIAFSDTGCGISPENLGRIFEPFFTTKRPGEGTGLGLSIGYGIIKEHNGAIEAESQGKDKGATFKISLPVASV